MTFEVEIIPSTNVNNAVLLSMNNLVFPIMNNVVLHTVNFTFADYNYLITI